ncbi:c-type cytochrome [Cupriavidus basilensis]
MAYLTGLRHTYPVVDRAAALPFPRKYPAAPRLPPHRPSRRGAAASTQSTSSSPRLPTPAWLRSDETTRPQDRERRSARAAQSGAQGSAGTGVRGLLVWAVSYIAIERADGSAALGDAGATSPRWRHRQRAGYRGRCKQLFAANCQACHQASGQGIRRAPAAGRLALGHGRAGPALRRSCCTA